MEFETEGDSLFVYVDARHSVKRTRQRVLHALAESGVADAILPLTPLRWDPHRNQYVDPAEPPVVDTIDPVEIRWAVVITPDSVWVEQAVRAELARLGRPVIGERGRSIEVGAVDEADADQLAAELAELPEISATTTRRLSRFARWRVREHLVGNYAQDPSVPPPPTLDT